MLKNELAILDHKEKELDQHKMWVQQSIKNVTDDAGNHEYLLINSKRKLIILVDMVKRVAVAFVVVVVVIVVVL